MPSAHEPTHAAPPDDGGHQGADTRPEETLAEGERPNGPPLHRDTTAARSPWGMTWGLVVAVGALIVVAWLLGLPYAP